MMKSQAKTGKTMPAMLGLCSLVAAAWTEVEVLDAGPVVVPCALEDDTPELATDGVALPAVELAIFELAVLEPVSEAVEPDDCPELADDTADDAAELDAVELPDAGVVVDAGVSEDAVEEDEADDDETLVTVLLGDDPEVDEDEDVSEVLAVLDADAVDIMLIVGLVADAWVEVSTT